MGTKNPERTRALRKTQKPGAHRSAPEIPKTLSSHSQDSALKDPQTHTTYRFVMALIYTYKSGLFVKVARRSEDTGTRGDGVGEAG
jgi:hypothetical protein